MNNRDQNKNFIQVNGKYYEVNWGVKKSKIDNRKYRVKDVIIENRFDFGENVEQVSRPFIQRRK